MERTFQTAIDVALIGAGRMGSIHGPNAARHPGFNLKYVVDRQGENARRLANGFGAEVVVLEEALADPSVGGVLVCSSTDQHLDHVLAAAEAGKAVFCEKPLDLDLDKVRAAGPALQDVRLMLAFNRRFDPHFVALKARVEAGAVGRLESLHLTNHDPSAPPPGFIPTSGGLFKDFTIHDLDLARWLLDEPIIEVFATASCLVDPEIGRQGDVDTARILLKTVSGRLCVISNTRRSGYGYDQRIEAFGSRGMVAAGNMAGDTVQVATEAGLTVAPILPGFLERYAGAYRAEMDHFAEVVHGMSDPAVGYEAGLQALALAEACDLSVRTGRPVRF